MDGFEEFVEAETPRLLGLAYALTGNPHDAGAAAGRPGAAAAP